MRPDFRGDVQHIAEDRVCDFVGLPDLDTLLHMGCLTYLRSFLVLDVKEAWSLAHAEGRWLGRVRASLAWLWEHSEAHE